MYRWDLIIRCCCCRSDTSTDNLQQLKKQRTDGKADSTAIAGQAAAGAGAAGAADLSVAQQGQVAWAKGVGYGYGRTAQGPVWDAKATQAAQEALDEQLCGLLQGLATALNEELAASSTASGADTPSSSKDTPAEPMDTGLSPQQQECFVSVQSSVLLPLLAREFGNVAFPEMVARHQYYKPLLAVLVALCRPATEQLLAANIYAAEHQAAASGAASSSTQHVQSIAGALRGLVRGATMYRERMAKALEQQQQQATTSAAANATAAHKKASKEAGMS